MNELLAYLVAAPGLWILVALVFAIGMVALAGPEPKARAARRMSRDL